MSDGSYSVDAIQNYFEYIIKIHETVENTSQILIYVTRIKNRIVFKIKSGYKLELLSKETNSKQVIDSNKDSKLVPKLEIVETVLVHCNLVTNDYQQASIVLFTFVPDKGFGQLMNINPHSPTTLKIVNGEFPFIKVWFTDEDNKPVEIEDNVNITLIVGINKL